MRKSRPAFLGGMLVVLIYLSGILFLVSSCTPSQDILIEDGQTQAASIEGWALLAEKDDYSDVPEEGDLPINYVNLDRLHGLLSESGWQEDNIHELREYDRQTLRQELVWLAENADEDDVVLFYISGHDSYIREGLEWESFIADDWGAIVSDKRLMIVDACRAASFMDVLDGDPQITIATVGRDELAWSGLPEEGLPIIGSVFVNYFVAAFDDLSADFDADGLVSVQEAAGFAELRQREYMHEVVFSVPGLIDLFHQHDYFPDEDPAYPHVIMDDGVGEAVFLDLGLNRIP